MLMKNSKLRSKVAMNRLFYSDVRKKDIISLNKVKLLFLTPILAIFSLKIVSAHCPLCTVEAGSAAGASVWFGVSKIIVALFIGAFAMSMGMWFSNLIKKKYIHFQKTIITLVVFLTTVLPLLPIFNAVGPLYIPFIGNYGLTYAFNYSVASSLLGGLVVFISPKLNNKIKEKRNGRGIPFQGILLTFLILSVIALIIQLAI